jgi:hypothetical protein
MYLQLAETDKAVHNPQNIIQVWVMDKVRQ